MIVITGQIFTDKETLPFLFTRLQELVEPTRREDGCVFYHMALEDTKKGVILAAEAWRDEDALSAHLSQPAVQQLLSDFEGKFHNDVQIHEVSSTRKM